MEAKSLDPFLITYFYFSIKNQTFHSAHLIDRLRSNRRLFTFFLCTVLYGVLSGCQPPSVKLNIKKWHREIPSLVWFYFGSVFSFALYSSALVFFFCFLVPSCTSTKKIYRVSSKSFCDVYCPNAGFSKSFSLDTSQNDLANPVKYAAHDAKRESDKKNTIKSGG